MPITTYPMAKPPRIEAGPKFITDLSWQAAASQALADIWFGAVPLVNAEERQVHWLAAIEDSLPTLEDAHEGDDLLKYPMDAPAAYAADEIADLRSCFEFIGAITVVNSQLMFADVLDTVIGKQRDYGHGNILKYGLTGITIRLSDKLERLKNLLAKELEPTNESVADTLLDVIGYSLLALMICDGTFTRELA